MENNELLQAMQAMIISSEEKMTSMLEALTEKVGSIDGRLTNIENKVGSLDNKVSSLESEVKKTNLTIENHLLPAVQALREGHMGVVDKLDVMNEKIDDIEESVIVLKVLQVKQ